MLLASLRAHAPTDQRSTRAARRLIAIGAPPPRLQNKAMAVEVQRATDKIVAASARCIVQLTDRPVGGAYQHVFCTLCVHNLAIAKIVIA